MSKSKKQTLKDTPGKKAKSSAKPPKKVAPKKYSEEDDDDLDVDMDNDMDADYVKGFNFDEEEEDEDDF